MSDKALRVVERFFEAQVDGRAEAWRVRADVFEHRLVFVADRSDRVDGVYDDGAETLIEGCLKWDGCNDFFIGGEGTVAHICGFKEWGLLTEVMASVYSMGPEMPAWDQ